MPTGAQEIPRGVRLRTRARRAGSWSAVGLLAVASSLFAGCSADPIEEAAHRRAVEAVLANVERDREWAEEQIASTYAEREYAPLWVGDTDLGRRGRRLLAALGELEEEGLPPPYDRAEIEALRRRIAADDIDDADRSAARAELEVRLAVAFLVQARDLLRGRFDPGRFGQDWRIEPDPLPSDALGRVSDGTPPGEVLASLRPLFPQYRRLVASLRRLRAIEAEGGWPAPSIRGPLEPEERSDGVRALRERLAASADEEERSLARSGGEADLFDEELRAALERFQTRHGLEPDGAVGPATLRELRTPVEDRIRSLEINLDRLRWMPRDLGPRAIVVNVAGFELELLEDNEPKFSRSVVVGRADWATRLFSATMDHFVLNPSWHVPASILREEILPAIRRDPTYAARQGFEVVGPGGVRGPAEVDWEDLANGTGSEEDGSGDDSLPRVRQAPGPRNALGRVKFMFPNPYNIYLHDTPERRHFGRSYRAFSHGCIRVERAVGLARYLVYRYTDRSPAEVDRILETGKQVTVELDRPVEVYIVYLTAWADEDGTTYFYRDIYDRDDVLHRQDRVADGSRATAARIEPRVQENRRPWDRRAGSHLALAPPPGAGTSHR